MHIAFISDTHAGLHSLKAVLLDIAKAGAGTLVNLGDVVGEPFVDHAVLQRDMSPAVWGIAPKGTNVTVTFARQTKTATVDETDRWSGSGLVGAVFASLFFHDTLQR